MIDNTYRVCITEDSRGNIVFSIRDVFYDPSKSQEGEDISPSGWALAPLLDCKGSSIEELSQEIHEVLSEISSSIVKPVIDLRAGEKKRANIMEKMRGKRYEQL